MTLEDTIRHASDTADELFMDENYSHSHECRQIASWLTELKMYRVKYHNEMLEGDYASGVNIDTSPQDIDLIQRLSDIMPCHGEFKDDCRGCKYSVILENQDVLCAIVDVIEGLEQDKIYSDKHNAH